MVYHIWVRCGGAEIGAFIWEYLWILREGLLRSVVHRTCAMRAIFRKLRGLNDAIRVRWRFTGFRLGEVNAANGEGYNNVCLYFQPGSLAVGFFDATSMYL